MSFQVLPLLFAGVFGIALLTLAFWAVIVRPRQRAKAFLSLAPALGAKAAPLTEKRHAYLDSRGYQVYALARVRSLTGSRLVLPEGAGSGAIEIDLIRTWTQRKHQHEWSTHLVFFMRTPGGPQLRIQRRASAFSILESEGRELLAEKFAADFRFGTGTPLEKSHQVGTDSPEQAQLRLTERRCRALGDATRKLHELVGSETAACVLRSPTGVALVIKEPPESLWQPASFAKTLALFRELAFPLIEPLED